MLRLRWQVLLRNACGSRLDKPRRALRRVRAYSERYRTAWLWAYWRAKDKGWLEERYDASACQKKEQENGSKERGEEMNKRTGRLLEIFYCRDCDSCLDIGKVGWCECGRTKRRMRYQSSVNNPIPKWCPLPVSQKQANKWRYIGYAEDCGCKRKIS